MKYEAIEIHRAEFDVKKVCKVFEIKAPNYYRWKKNKEKSTFRKTKELQDIKRVEKVFLDSDKTYGYRMITQHFKKGNDPMSEYRVRRLMRENGFYPETQRKYKPTHNGKKSGKYFDNIVKQKFKVNQRNQIWVGDITYIKTMLGWVYLAVVMDLYNREVIGYSISKKINTELVKEALSNAIIKNGVSEELVFHSDRGCQYLAKGIQRC